MIRTLSERNEIKIAPPSGFTELVRGTDHSLVAQLEPVVRRQNVTLDLHTIGRIDAAGVAALISLYGCARDAGHEFKLCNVPSRVAQILAIVGLDEILLSHAPGSQCEVCLEISAA